MLLLQFHFDTYSALIEKYLILLHDLIYPYLRWVQPAVFE